MSSKQEKKAKNYISSELQEIVDTHELSVEEQLELEQIRDNISGVIKEIEKDTIVEKYMESFGHNAFLKARLVRLFCSGLYTNKQIATILHVSPPTVSRWLGNEDVRAAINEVQAHEDFVMSAKLRAVRDMAINKQIELIQSAENEMVSAMMIKDVLDRTGHKPVEKQEIQHNITYEEKLQQIIEGIEVEYEVIDDTDTTNTGEEDISD